MAAAAISSFSSRSSPLFKLSYSPPWKDPLSSLRYSSRPLILTAVCRLSYTVPFPYSTSGRSGYVAAVVDKEEAPFTLTDDPPFEEVSVREVNVLDEVGGGFSGGKGEDGEGFGGGGGGGGGGGDDGKGSKGEGEGQSGKEKNLNGMSMSQKLTLGYATLVGVGGIVGFIKSGSLKSLAAGGGSALILYYVYTQLPVKSAFASSLGFGVSAALLAVMGSRFKSSGKIFPAGIVSLVSFVMAGGYIHGILRSLD